MRTEEVTEKAIVVNLTEQEVDCICGDLDRGGVRNARGCGNRTIVLRYFHCTNTCVMI